MTSLFILTMPPTAAFMSMLDYWVLGGVNTHLRTAVRGHHSTGRLVKALARAEGAFQHKRLSAEIIFLHSEREWYVTHHPVVNDWSLSGSFDFSAHSGCYAATILCCSHRRHWGWERVDPWWLTFCWSLLGLALHDGACVNLRVVMEETIHRCPATLLPPRFTEGMCRCMEWWSADHMTSVCALCQYLPLLSPGHLRLMEEMPTGDGVCKHRRWRLLVSCSVTGMAYSRKGDDVLGMWDWMARHAGTSLHQYLLRRYRKTEVGRGRTTIALFHVYNVLYFQPQVSTLIGHHCYHHQIARTLCQGMARRKLNHILEEVEHSNELVPKFCSPYMDITGYYKVARPRCLQAAWSSPRAAEWLVRTRQGGIAVSTGLVDPYRGSVGTDDGALVLYHPGTMQGSACPCIATGRYMWSLGVLDRLLGQDLETPLSVIYRTAGLVCCRRPIPSTGYNALHTLYANGEVLQCLM